MDPQAAEGGIRSPSDDTRRRGVAGLAALVTGGGSGIGFGAAARLVRDGAHVTICGRTEERLQAAVAKLETQATEAAVSRGEGVGATATAERSPVEGSVMPGRIRYVVADVTIEEDVERAVATSLERDRLDVLFANAGGSMHMGPITEADVAQVRATIDLNLVGTFLCIKHAAPHMAAGVGRHVDGGTAPGGSIVGMSSGAGHFPHRYLWAYGSAKAGIDMLCRYAAEELGSSGVRVNTVRPGIIDDELMAPITAGGPLLEDYLSETPLGRVGAVDDVADAVRFLAGPESAWITGECLAVDGGHHLRRGANYSLLFG